MSQRVAPMLLAIVLPALPAQHVIDVACCQFTDSVSGTNQTVIPAGTTVLWQWSGFVPHTVTSGTGSSDPQSGLLFNATLHGGNQTFSRTFNTPGFFPYYCQPHEFLPMAGDILVTVPAAATPFGSGCGGAILTTSGLPTIGNGGFAFNVSAGPASGTAYLFIATTTTPNPLFIGPPNCLLHLELNSLLALISVGLSPLGPPITLSPGGAGAFPLPLPGDNGLMGIQFAAQVLAFPAGSSQFVVTNAVNIQVGA